MFVPTKTAPAVSITADIEPATSTPTPYRWAAPEEFCSELDTVRKGTEKALTSREYRQSEPWKTQLYDRLKNLIHLAKGTVYADRIRNSLVDVRMGLELMDNGPIRDSLREVKSVYQEVCATGQ